MRFRVTIETDFAGNARTFRESLRSTFLTGELAKAVPGDIVYIATDLAETAVVTHDGKTVTVG